MSETAKTHKPGERARSMTGYAETIAERDGMVLTVSLRSVNHRFLDLHVHLPDALQSLEPKIRREIQDRNPRGRKFQWSQEGGKLAPGGLHIARVKSRADVQPFE